MYKEIYPGIDWIIYIKEGNLKYDFVVKPYANPNLIKIKYSHAEQILNDNEGNIILRNRLGDIVENKPISIQNEKNINTSFVLTDSILEFKIDNYNKSITLIIDPIIEWSTYYGGSANDGFSFIDTDSDDNIYTIGSSNSSANLSYLGFQSIKYGNFSCIIVKFDKFGNRKWGTYFGNNINLGKNNSFIDSKKNIILAGQTDAVNPNFSFNGHQNYLAGMSDGIIFKLDSNGYRLWCSYYGGSDIDRFYTLDIDSADNIYAVGNTTSSSNIAFNGYQDTFYYKYTSTGAVMENTFLVKFNSNGVRQWATYYGLDTSNKTYSLVDKNNHIIIVKLARDTALVLDQNCKFCNISTNYIVAKFNSFGQRLKTYCSSISTSINNNSDLEFDNYNNLYFTCSTGSSGLGFNGFQNTFGGGGDGLLIKLDTNYTRIWSTYIGGSNNDYTSSIDIKNNYLYITGVTYSTNNIFLKGINNSLKGPFDGFIFKYSLNCIKIWGSYFGGTSFDFINDIKIDSRNNIVFVGNTFSTNFISKNGFLNSYQGLGDGFLTKISCNRDTTLFDTICQNEKIFFNSQFRSKTAIYLDTLETWDGCDSFITLDLTVLRVDTTYLYDTICEGQFVFFNTLQRRNSGIYFDTLTNSVGCDSLLILNLTIKRVDTTHIYDTSCHNLPKSFNGQSLASSGLYRDTLTNSVGCDSFIYYHFKPKPVYSFTSSISICTYDSVLFGGKYRTQSGLYYDSLKTKDGCDSVYSLQVSLKPLDTTYLSQSICRGQSVLFNSIIYTQSGIYRDTLKNKVGCDSFIYLTIAVRDTSHFAYTQSQCSGVPYFFNNTWLSLEGVYRDTLVNAAGCDSFVSLTLLHNQLIYDTIRINRCYGDTYKNYTLSGVYHETYTSYLGCDSLVTIMLTYLPIVQYKSVTYSRCGSFSLLGNTYLKNDTVIERIKNQLNCDSLITTYYIFITQPNPIIKEIVLNYFCEEIYIKGKNYTTSFYTQDTIKSTIFPYCDSLIQPLYYQRETRPVTKLKAIPSDTILQGESITIEAQGAYHYLWDNGSNETTISEILTANKLYTIRAWNLADCEDSALISIAVIEPILLDMPSAFSPNSDGKNDILFPNSKGSIQITSFEIYNRWGEKVYSYSPNSSGWNGYYNQLPAPTGLYTYTIEYRYLKRTMIKSGEVMLVRD